MTRACELMWKNRGKGGGKPHKSWLRHIPFTFSFSHYNSLWVGESPARVPPSPAVTPVSLIISERPPPFSTLYRIKKIFFQSKTRPQSSLIQRQRKTLSCSVLLWNSNLKKKLWKKDWLVKKYRPVFFQLLRVKVQD